MTSRRHFLATLPSIAILASAAPAARAQAVRLQESDPAAKAIGYIEDAAKVDVKKYPAFKPGSQCANCQLYQGKPGTGAGPCAAVGGKLVAAKGWCIVWVKKAG
jgi:hypothetical protein